MSQSAAGGPGQCSVCGSAFRLVASSSVLRKHGWSSSQTAPYAGFGEVPLGSTVWNPASSAAVAQSQLEPPLSCNFNLVPGSISLPFEFKSFGGSILKRLPKGARSLAASVLLRCLRQLLSDGQNPTHWWRLLQFPASFAQPLRGGKRHNLTSRILAQLYIFDEGHVVQCLGNTEGLVGKKRV